MTAHFWTWLTGFNPRLCMRGDMTETPCNRIAESFNPRLCMRGDAGDDALDADGQVSIHASA